MGAVLLLVAAVAAVGATAYYQWQREQSARTCPATARAPARRRRTHYVVTAAHLPTYLPQLRVTPGTLLTRFGNAVGISPDLEQSL